MYAVEEFEHNGIAVRIVADDEAPNPRAEFDPLTVMTQLGRHPQSPGGDDDQDELIVRAWDRAPRARDDIEFIERYARAYLGAVGVGWWDDPRSSSRVFAYVTSVGMAYGWGDGQWTAEDAQRMVQGELDEYRQWAEGEVYGAIVAPDEPDADSVWMLYGLDYAMEEARGMADSLAAQREKRAKARTRAEESAIEKADRAVALLGI